MERNFINKLLRNLAYAKYNIRDFFDSYLSPLLSPCKTPLGFIFTGSNSIHHKSMQKGTFEPLEVDWLTSELANADVFIDVGANAGYFSCLARQLGKKVLAIEPLWSNLQILLRNIELNQGPQVEVIPVGLSDNVGVMSLHGFSSTGASLISNWAGAPSLSSRRIPVSTMDNIVSDRFQGKNLVIKIDVEGFEFQVIKGSQALLTREISPVWLIEITNAQFHPNGVNPNFKMTYHEFWKNNYDCYVLTSNGIKYIELDDFDSIESFQSIGLINYIFKPK
jgi:FkbM family methyltransferase